MKNLSKFLNESLISEMPDNEFWKSLTEIMKKGPKYNGSICFYEETGEAFRDIYKYFKGNKDKIVSFGHTFFGKAVEIQDECDCDTHSDDDAEYSAWTAVMYCKSEKDFKDLIKGGEYPSDDAGEIFGYAVCPDEESFEDCSEDYL